MEFDEAESTTRAVSWQRWVAYWIGTVSAALLAAGAALTLWLVAAFTCFKGCSDAAEEQAQMLWSLAGFAVAIGGVVLAGTLVVRARDLVVSRWFPWIAGTGVVVVVPLTLAVVGALVGEALR